MEQRLTNLIENQRVFQRFVGLPIDSILEEDRDRLAEGYVLKLIEETVELRREFPSYFNKMSKSQKQADTTRIGEELSDVFLFFVNLLVVWKFPLEKFVGVAERVQHNNFTKIKQKKLDLLSTRILQIPGHTTGIGSGTVNPKYIFIGLNPGQGITHGYRFWSDAKDGSSKVLLPILDRLGLLSDSYFTNYVKSITVNNTEPTDDEAAFWLPFLEEELNILTLNNPGVKIVAMGKWVRKKMGDCLNIMHPAAISYGTITPEEYEKQIKKELGL